MRARAELAALILVAVFPTTAGRLLADASTPSTLDQPPQAVVTSEWAGLWQVNEETRDCTSGEFIRTSSYLDTLCTGDAVFLMPGESLTRGGYVYATCSGPGFTSAAFNLTCSIGGICGCMGTCSSGYTNAVEWMRNGDEATTLQTYSVSYSAPGGCAPPNWCRRTIGTRTRIANEATMCSPTPTLRSSWGKLKIMYR